MYIYIYTHSLSVLALNVCVCERENNLATCPSLSLSPSLVLSVHFLVWRLVTSRMSAQRTVRCQKPTAAKLPNLEQRMGSASSWCLKKNLGAPNRATSTTAGSTCPKLDMGTARLAARSLIVLDAKPRSVSKCIKSSSNQNLPDHLASSRPWSNSCVQ